MAMKPMQREGSEAELQRLRDEIVSLKGKEAHLQRRLDSRRMNPGGKRCCCCLLSIMAALMCGIAPPTAFIMSLRASFRRELPERAQLIADWLISHPVMPRTAVKIAETLFDPTRKRSPGEDLMQRGVAVKHPVVMVPGFTSTALEMWQGQECAARAMSHRARIYSGPAMVKLMGQSMRCWLRHLALDPATWSDPGISRDSTDSARIKLRAAMGLTAADYFGGSLTGPVRHLWFLWGKLIMELSHIGYDDSSLHMASYDWRLSPQELQQRDGYFTKLKATIESLRASSPNRERVVVLAHSMGANVFYYFMQWVSCPLQHFPESTDPELVEAYAAYLRDITAVSEEQLDRSKTNRIAKAKRRKQERFLFANKRNAAVVRAAEQAAQSWIDHNVKAVVNIGSALLGSPKVLNALMTGDMRDVLSLWAPMRNFVSSVVSRFDFLALFRSWGSMPMLMPFGGERIWGNNTWAPDDEFSATSATGLGEKPAAAAFSLDFSSNKPHVDASPGHTRTFDSSSLEDSEGDFESSVGKDARPSFGAMIRFHLSPSTRIFDSTPGEGHGAPNTTRFMGSTARSPAEDESDRINDVLDTRTPLSKERLRSLLHGHDGTDGAELSVTEAHVLLREMAPQYGRLIDDHYSFGASNGTEPVWKAGYLPERYWTNVFAAPLPTAPKLNLYCLHGTGVVTDRSFHLTTTPTFLESGDDAPSENEPNTTKFALPFTVDTSREDTTNGLETGVQTVSTGDGTLTSLSLGYPCARLWKKGGRHNPGGANVVLREYKHVNAESPSALWTLYEEGRLANAQQSIDEKPPSAASSPSNACGSDDDTDLISGNDGSLSQRCVSVDLDSDGVSDGHVWDVDKDGIPDKLDVDGDGRPDANVVGLAVGRIGESPRLQLDHDGDGIGDQNIPPAALLKMMEALHSKYGVPKRNASEGNCEQDEEEEEVEEELGGNAGINTTASVSTTSTPSMEDAAPPENRFWRTLISLLKEADLNDLGRGVGLAADHINILGNNQLIDDVLRIVTGIESADWTHSNGQIKKEEEERNSTLLQSRVFSNILEVAARVEGKD